MEEDLKHQNNENCHPNSPIRELVKKKSESEKNYENLEIK